MNSYAKLTTTLGAALAIAASTTSWAAGTASASIPDGQYTVQIYAPLLAVTWLPPLSSSATVRNDTLHVAGLTGHLVSTTHGYRTDIAGQRVILTNIADESGFDGDAGDYLISSTTGATLGQLIAR